MPDDTPAPTATAAPPMAPLKAAAKESDAERIDRETREVIAGNKKATEVRAAGQREKFDKLIAGKERELKKVQDAAAKDANPRKVAIADLTRHIRHFTKMRDALPK